jgi:serine/threonine protein kinase
LTASLQELLAQHQRGSLSLEVFRARLLDLADANTTQLSRWIAEVRAEIATGRISVEVGRSVLDMLTAANSQTEVAAQTENPIQATLVRSIASATPNESDATEVIGGSSPRVEQTFASPDARQSHASGVDDQTRRKSADATVGHDEHSTQRQDPAVAEATQRKASPSPADPTVRMRAPSVETAARTLRTPSEPNAVAEGFPATLSSPDRTEVIADRLVKSLDDVELEHRGPLQAGSVVKKRFVLEKLIGKGGMGLVFCALDRRKVEASDPNPRVALKMLNADFQRHPQSLIALQREARKAQTLAHPNVVTVFDFDRDGDAVYMTMELLKGRALEAFVREGRGKGIEPAIALPIIRGIAEGLAYAHRKGIVHSDLKPGNIFILEDGTPKILDFGIARAVPNAASNEAPDLFDAGSLGAYTEAYATDEMVDGVDPHPADDMYALGIIAYELLTGFHPYQRHSAPKARELGVRPPPLKGLKLREARALERCLSFERKQRPQNAAEFLKLFRGVTLLQQATLAATVVLALAAGYLSYENYRETSPTIAFSALPAATQMEFTRLMREGDNEWRFYVNEQNVAALDGAMDHYAEAYKLHPRNRDAVKALSKAADALLAAVEGDPQQRRKIASELQDRSDYYRRYPPVIDAAE